VNASPSPYLPELGAKAASRVRRRSMPPNACESALAATAAWISRPHRAGVLEVHSAPAVALR